MANVLTVDDDADIRDMLDMHLSLAGHQCLSAKDTAAARFILGGDSRVDIALVDIMMPGEDGFSLAETLISRHIPVIFLTAKTRVEDRVRGLTMGAEDYVLKPFEPAELLARIDVILRRSAHQGAVWQSGDIHIDAKARQAFLKGEPVTLTALEFDLLYLLVKNEGRAMSREDLLALVWGYGYAGETRTVDVHVQRLRSKIGADAIETVYKYGYRFGKGQNT